jgi:hypothetical protein
MTIKKLFFPIAIALVFFVVSCERNYDLLDENNQYQYVDTTANGFLKVVHAYAPLTPTINTGTGPKVMVIIDGQRALRDSLAFNATYPNSSGAYAVVPKGNHTIYFVISRPGNPPPASSAGDTVFRTTVNVEANKYYTAFLADSTQSPGVLVTNDNFRPIPSLSFYKVRFTNLIANPNERYDVYADSAQRMIATNIGYRQVTDFIDAPVPRSTENFSVRLTGTTTVVYTLTNFTPSPQRAYTLYTRGRVGVTGRAPGITFYTNR